MSVQVTISGSTRPTSCPLCRGDLADRAMECDGCGTAYHRACLVDLGGCGTLGCARRGRVPGGRELRVAARSSAAGGYLVAAGVALATLGGLLGLSRLGAFLHAPPRRASSAPARTAPTPTPTPTPPRPGPRPRTSPRPLPDAPPADVRTVDRHQSRLAEVTRATEQVQSALQLLDVCERAAQGRSDGWDRGLLERALQQDDPLPGARACVQRARLAGASDEEVLAATRTSRLHGGDEAQAAALLLGSGPSPFARELLEPRLRAALAVLDREVERQASAVAYAEALEGSITRDKIVATLEGILLDPEATLDLAEWRARFAGPDPHQVAREARRAFVALGGEERPRLTMPSYARPAELRVGKLLVQAVGVLAADDAAPTPTARVLATIEARTRR